MSFSQHLRRLGQPIAYYPQLAKPLGGVTAAVLFGQIFYWQDKTENPLGVYKTQAELEQETGLGRREQETARKKLVELGILIETHKRLEHRIYFKLDLAKFDALMESIREVANPPFVNTKITTENTNNTNLTVSNARTRKSDALDLLEQFGITGQLAEDFVKHRKACRSTITKTALDGFQREADKAGISIQQAVSISIERGWRGFKSSWEWEDAQPKSRQRGDNLSQAWNTPEAWEGVL
ncbi:hypothetical protein EV693_10347 [Nicoletella semolina]|uniref:Uncharacterized protein n=1 Tax=Nicoletella semolina TaxID=271160 RepID=A0A4R2NAW6_9PAST|nr:DNA replication protein [Nicoletella semolina]TCP18082.1 hypothetical protein EV693_10347 [Nicoletella semolina]